MVLLRLTRAARYYVAATLARGRFFVFRNLRPPEAQLSAPKRRTARELVGTSLHASLSRRFQMVFSALALNASAAAPKVRQTSKSARRPRSSVSAKPAFAARTRADVGVARMSGSRRIASRMVIAAAGARFSEIFARRGLVVDFGGSWLLPRLVGMHRAKELVLLADIIDAAEADRIGLVNRVVPEAELDATVDSIAARLAAGPPIALAMSKRLLNNSFDVTLEQALDDEGLAQTVTFTTEDVAEAMSAFIDKRDPVFRGR